MTQVLSVLHLGVAGIPECVLIFGLDDLIDYLAHLPGPKHLHMKRNVFMVLHGRGSKRGVAVLYTADFPPWASFFEVRRGLLDVAGPARHPPRPTRARREA